MKTVILCGGKGTRLGEDGLIRPKPLVEIGGKPVLWHIMKSYYTSGFDEFVLCLGHRGSMIKEWFLEPGWKHYDIMVVPGSQCLLETLPRWSAIFTDTGEDTETGERVARAAKYLQTDEPFFLTYGDGLADIDFLRLHSAHEQRGRLGTVTMVKGRSRFGSITHDPDMKITSFNEKEDGELINGGFMVFEPGALKYFTKGSDVGKDVLPAMVADGELTAYYHDGYWACMDTPKDVETLNKEYAAGRHPWVVW